MRRLLGALKCLLFQLIEFPLTRFYVLWMCASSKPKWIKKKKKKKLKHQTLLFYFQQSRYTRCSLLSLTATCLLYRQRKTLKTMCGQTGNNSTNTHECSISESRHQRNATLLQESPRTHWHFFDYIIFKMLTLSDRYVIFRIQCCATVECTSDVPQWDAKGQIRLLLYQ